jgi:hypothetical protein
MFKVIVESRIGINNKSNALMNGWKMNADYIYGYLFAILFSIKNKSNNWYVIEIIQ